MKIYHIRTLILLVSIFLCGTAHPSTYVVAVQPLGKLDPEIIQQVVKGITGLYKVQVEVLAAIDLPVEAYYKPRNRYRAEKLLEHLEKIRNSRFYRILGITEKDISTTKGAYEDWGILGLGSLSGNVCVVSTFRMGKGKVLKKQFYERLVKVVNHELGHTFGLEHCPQRSCLMEDARGTVKTVDTETGKLCEKCRERIKELVR